MKTVCETCIHHCSLSPGQTGLCRARRNENGKIVCSNYGQVTSLALDPIEKKPLKMFWPGTAILSVGSYGCNLRCPFCQNYQISMWDGEAVEAAYFSPEDLAEKAAAYQGRGNIGVAFTYTEPMVGWEYVRDTAKLVKEAGMKNVLVTNGTASAWALEEILPFIDAMNIDLKGFREEYYQKLGGSLGAVKEFIRRAAEHCHVELTTLIVPGENDGEMEMREEAKWIASVGRKTALHVTRFFPRYHMVDRQATEVERVQRLAGIAREYLDNVFV